MVTNDEIVLPIVEPVKGEYWIYLFIPNVIFIVSGLISFKYEFFPPEIVFFIIVAIPLFGTLVYINIIESLKKFKISNNKIILQKQKIILFADNQSNELPIHNINMITVKYSGYDERLYISNTIFSRRQRKGNDNFIAIFYNDSSQASYEFYIKNKRDSIVLMNILQALKRIVNLRILTLSEK